MGRHGRSGSTGSPARTVERSRWPAEPLVEAVGVGAGRARSELEQSAALTAGPVDTPLDEPGTEAVAALGAVDPYALDGRAGRALGRDGTGNDREPEPAEGCAVTVGDDQQPLQVTLRSLTVGPVRSRIVRRLAGGPQRVVRDHGGDGREGVPPLATRMPIVVIRLITTKYPIRETAARPEVDHCRSGSVHLPTSSNEAEVGILDSVSHLTMRAVAAPPPVAQDRIGVCRGARIRSGSCGHHPAVTN